MATLREVKHRLIGVGDLDREVDRYAIVQLIDEALGQAGSAAELLSLEDREHMRVAATYALNTDQRRVRLTPADTIALLDAADWADRLQAAVDDALTELRVKRDAGQGLTSTEDDVLSELAGAVRETT